MTRTAGQATEITYFTIILLENLSQKIPSPKKFFNILFFVDFGKVSGIKKKLSLKLLFLFENFNVWQKVGF